MTGTYKYNRKTDLAIDDLRTFVASYEALRDHYKANNNALTRGGTETNEAISTISLSELLTVMSVQSKINDSLLELIYSILPEYNLYEVTKE